MDSKENKFGLATVIEEVKGNREILDILHKVWDNYSQQKSIPSELFTALSAAVKNHPRAEKVQNRAYKISGKLAKILETKPENNSSGYLAVWEEIGKNKDNKQIDSMINTIDISHADFMMSFQGVFGGYGIPIQSTIPMTTRGYLKELYNAYKNGQRKEYLDSTKNLIQRNKSEYLLKNKDNIMSGMDTAVIKMGIDRITHAEIILLENIVNIMANCGFQYGHDKAAGRLKQLKEGIALEDKIISKQNIDSTLHEEEIVPKKAIITTPINIIKKTKVYIPPTKQSDIQATQKDKKNKVPPSRQAAYPQVPKKNLEGNPPKLENKDIFTKSREKYIFPDMPTPLQEAYKIPSLKDLSDIITIVNDKVINEDEVREKFGMYAEDILERTSWYMHDPELYEKLHSECVRKIVNESINTSLVLKLYSEDVITEMIDTDNYVGIKEYILILGASYDKRYYDRQLHKADILFKNKLTDINTMLIQRSFSLADYYKVKTIDISNKPINFIIEVLQKLLDLTEKYKPL